MTLTSYYTNSRNAPILDIKPSDRFAVSPSFIDGFKGRNPEFGPVGLITYKRTYARPLPDGSTEDYWQTLERIVNGIYTVQKWHCHRHNLPWSDSKAQRSAQTMYQLMWDFKFLPGGRGLWMMGTQYVEERGSAALNNPLHEDTKILTREHGWTRLGDIEGQKVHVLSSAYDYGSHAKNVSRAAGVSTSKWVEASISHVEKHHCLEIEFEDCSGNTTKIISSQNHRWFRRRTTKQDWERVVTEELCAGDYVPIVKPPRNFKPSPIGFLHGMFFGDGTRSNGELHLFGAKAEVAQMVAAAETLDTGTRDGEQVLRQCPIAWSSVPTGDYRKDQRYVWGFLSGYVAADGHVDEKGNVSISSARRDELVEVANLFRDLGVRVSEPIETIQAGAANNLVENRSALYAIKITPIDFDAKFFLRKDQRERWEAAVGTSKRDWMKVKSIAGLAGEHPVLCAEVPGYEQFVIDGFVLTSNCSFVSTADIDKSFSEPFCFLMDFSMLGVGVGGDCKGAGKVVIQQPVIGDDVHVVDDTREGWVDLIARVLEAYVGKATLPASIDFSKIRPYGTPIKSFGGTAAGPEPLQRLVAGIHSALSKIIGKPITSEAIVDIFDMIGVCVVAGNVRRCLSHKQLVATENGSVQIEKVKVGDRVLTASGAYRPVTNVFEQGVQKTIRVVTDMGDIVCTPNHRVAVFTGLKTYDWKPAGELTPDDRLLSVPHTGGSAAISTDRAYLLGFYAGNGYADVEKCKARKGGGGEVAFAMSTERLKGSVGQKLTSVLEQMGYDPSEDVAGNDGKLWVYKKELADDLLRYKKSWEAPIVPQEVIEGTPEIRAAWLAGLADADGTTRNVLVNNIHVPFLQSVQKLCLSLGIATRVHVRPPKRIKGRSRVYEGCHWLSLRGNRSKELASKIIGPHAARWTVEEGEGCKKNGLSLPAAFLIDEFKAQRRLSEITAIVRDSNSRPGAYRNPNYDTLIEMGVVNENWLPLRVCRIEDAGEVPTYDIEVEGDHEFICEGMLVHNSAIIMFGEGDDEAFLNLKNPAINKEAMMSHRWACVTGDTLVDTTEGLRPISKLVGREDVFVRLNGENHKALGVKLTGHRPTFVVATKGGPTIRATENHEFMTTRGWVRLDALRPNDRLIINDNKDVTVDRDSSDYRRGYMLGMLIGDGTFTKTTTTGAPIARLETFSKDLGEESLRNYVESIFDFKTRSTFNGFSGPHGAGDSKYYFLSAKDFTEFAASYGVVKGNKVITDEIVQSDSLELQAGVLSGLFDTDGWVVKDRKSLAIEQVDLATIQKAQQILLRLGIASRINRARSEQVRVFPGGVSRKCSEVWRLTISGYEQASRFVKACGIHHSAKLEAWRDITPPPTTKARHTFAIERIVPTGECEDVYDICVPGPTAFSANGLYVHNSNNSIFAKVGMDYTRTASVTQKAGEPGFMWLDNAKKFGRMGELVDDSRVGGFNPCQIASAPVLTPTGIKTFAEIDAGSIIWSGKQWTKVLKKWSTGIKPTFEFRTRAGVFYGTENHRVVQNGEKIEVKDAESIDIAVGPSPEATPLNPIDVIDGLIIGDGTDYKGHGEVALILGSKDVDIISSEVSHLLIDRVPSPTAESGEYWLTSNTVSVNELPETYNRTVPDRFFYGPQEKVRGFLRGLYSANGSVVGSRVTLKAASFSVIEDVQQMLSAIGIRSYYTVNKSHDVEFDNGTYTCRESYDLNIGPDRHRFRELIGFIQSDKAKRLDAICDKPVSEFARRGPKTSFEIVERNNLGEQEVFDITVEADEHTYWTGGLLVSNCAEIGLEPFELCNLCELFPSRHASYEEFERTIKFAYLYAKTVSLIPTHNSKTNAVMLRNRRIGLSQSGIVQSFARHGRRAHFEWCDRGYAYVTRLDKMYSEWLCVRPSIKKTTVKPAGCWKYDSLISTDDGIYRFDELVDDKTSGWQDQTVRREVQTRFGAKAITKGYNNGVKPTKQITTEDGLRLEITLEHPLLVDKGGEHLWIKAADLQVGDRLVSRLGQYFKRSESKLVPVDRKPDGRTDGFTGPSEMSPDIAWFVGYLFGNGSIHEKGVRFTYNKKQTGLERWIIEFTKNTFGFEAKVDDDKTIYLSSQGLLEWLKVNGLQKHYSSDIRVPKAIRTASADSIRAFISGVWRADGGIHNRSTWTVCSVSKEFAQELLVLGRAVGLNLKVKSAGPGEWGSLDRWIISSRSLDDPTASRYSSKDLRGRAVGDGLWADPIRSIFDSESLTLDVEVADVHEYTAQSIVSHNTTSLLPGVTPGIHHEHAAYYFRTIRVAKNSPLVEQHRAAGYRVEDDIYDKASNTAVIYFPIKAQFFDRGKDEISMWEQLENTAQMQKHWSDNSVSVTVTFKKDEASDIARALELYESRLKTVSFLPLEEHGYEQAPYITISESDYEKAMSQIRAANLTSAVHEVTERFCDGDVCTVPVKKNESSV